MRSKAFSEKARRKFTPDTILLPINILLLSCFKDHSKLIVVFLDENNFEENSPVNTIPKMND